MRAAFIVLLAASVISSSDDERAARDVAAGGLKVAKASRWGFDPVDSTKALQAAINSGVPTLIIDKRDQPWVTDKLELASDQEIVLEKGVEIVAKKGALVGAADSLFTASAKKNVSISGYGATIRMRRSDYLVPPYQPSEWRHCLRFMSCSGVRVSGLTLRECGGDGIYLGSEKSLGANRDVTIKDVIAESNHRQGISVISAENLLIDGATLRSTAGTPPQAGIDFEPNGPDDRLVNCLVRNSLSEGNAGAGFLLELKRLARRSLPVSVRFEGCRSRGNRGPGFEFHSEGEAGKSVGGSVVVAGGTFNGDQLGGIAVYGNAADGCSLAFEDCTISDPAPQRPTISPIALSAASPVDGAIGGVRFSRCVVRDSLNRPPLSVHDFAGNVPLSRIEGDLVVEAGGRRTSYALTRESIARWAPTTAFRKFPAYDVAGANWRPLSTKEVPAPGAYPRLRGRVALALYARTGQRVSLGIRFLQVGNYSGGEMPVTVTAPSGKEVLRSRVPFRQEGEVGFDAPETGLFRIVADTGVNMMQVARAAPAVSLLGTDGPIHFISSVGRFYFVVPPGTKDFGIRAWGKGEGEAVRIALFDAKGRLLAERDDVVAPAELLGSVAPASTTQVLSLETMKASREGMQDYFVELHGVPPLLAISPDAAIVPGDR